jgi:N-acetylmuramoyl-L-alanine amidase CwlA
LVENAIKSLGKNTKDNFVLEDIKTDFKSIKGKIIDVVDNSHYITAKIQEADKVVYQNFFISNDKIIPYYKKQLNMNYSKGVKNKVKYLVIHETANENEGADASAHYKYWSKNSSAKASTHFVVDSNEIYQMLELDQVAWHVGDNKGYSEITNTNSIGIEIAVNSDGNYIKAREHAIELTVQLMRELNMDISQLKRHYDASGKNCPAHILSEKFWDEFVNQVKVELEK